MVIIKYIIFSAEREVRFGIVLIVSLLWSNVNCSLFLTRGRICIFDSQITHKWPRICSDYLTTFPSFFLRMRFVTQCALSMSNMTGYGYDSGDQSSLQYMVGFVMLCLVFCECVCLVIVFRIFAMTLLFLLMVRIEFPLGILELFSTVVQSKLKWRFKNSFCSNILYLNLKFTRQRNLWWVWFVCSNIFFYGSDPIQRLLIQTFFFRGGKSYSCVFGVKICLFICVNLFTSS